MLTFIAGYAVLILIAFCSIVLYKQRDRMSTVDNLVAITALIVLFCVVLYVQAKFG